MMTLFTEITHIYDQTKNLKLKLKTLKLIRFLNLLAVKYFLETYSNQKVLTNSLRKPWS